MRRRITAVLLAVMTLALVALGVPLARSMSDQARQDLYVSRLADATRFASLAQQADSQVDLQVLEQDLRRYEDVYGVAGAVLDRQGEVLVSSGSEVGLDEAGAFAVQVALTGRRPEPVELANGPGGPAMVIAEPVVQGGDVTAVAVTVSPLDRVEGAVLARWLLLAVGMAAALALCAVIALRLATWVLRPVSALDRATQAVATGRLTARVPETAGPPELRRLGVAFNSMAENVESLVEQQRAFVADASHQLRNPLSALLLRLDAVALSHPEVADGLGAVRSEGDRLTAVLDELLQLARAENTATEPVPVAVAGLVRERAEVWQVVARSRSLRLDVVTEEPLVALAHATTLSTVVDALVDNAVKFSEAGGAVELRASHDGDDVVVATRNTERLLGEEDLRRMGDRFWRSPRHQNVSGSGLGLSIVRVLVQRWGGALEVRRCGADLLEVAVRLPSVPAARSLGRPAQPVVVR